VLALLAGGFLIVAGLFRLGFLANFISDCGFRGLAISIPN
jgi:MFS superfamily sulfate permease-like transporter